MHCILNGFYVGGLKKSVVTSHTFPMYIESYMENEIGLTLLGALEYRLGKF